MTSSQSSPPKVYGLALSYFTGKLEGYLRCKGIDYTSVNMDYRMFGGLIPEKTGAAQMPAVELADGRWMTDTTAIIQWFEQTHTDNPIIPTDPVQAFICYLIEDYADEWLWRAAMHYRWSYEQGRTLLSTQIVDAMLGTLPVPKTIMRKMMARRQHTNFVVKDGVTKDTWDHVESGYLKLLDMLNPILAERNFLLGDKPSLADIGLFGPFFRHFGIDPTPAGIMRERAPAVYAWLARIWDGRNIKSDLSFGQGIPDDLMPLLAEAAETHLEYLCANAEAYNAGERRFDVIIQGITYRNMMTSRYRVWCLEKLREKFELLPVAAQQDVKTLLENSGAWEPLWRIESLNSGFDKEGQLPFASGIEVFATEERDRGEAFFERIVNWFIQPSSK
ncbi:glutathione S-transferase family protein [Maricurvus nonylphenolicus]|uniref:glutathione S-transferase family protein n=1 Tax=Maricurvus nonylphenolicus TaxID=1008307 RepID=UPI0036F27DD1